jgi:hypothetical protein
LSLSLLVSPCDGPAKSKPGEAAVTGPSYCQLTAN